MALDKHLIAKTKPIANSKNIVLFKSLRITVLGDRLIRLERSVDSTFRDGATQSIWFRDFAPVEFSTEQNGDCLVLKTASRQFFIYEETEKCAVLIGDKKVPVSNEGNLKGTYRTLDGCDGDNSLYVPPIGKVRLGDGVCSRSGVAVIHDAGSLVLGDDGKVVSDSAYSGTDDYIFAFGDDYQGAVHALYSITGRVPRIPRFALGNWWSRYHAYSDEEYLELLTDFERHGIPLTVATVDMDWHWSTTVNERFEVAKRGWNDGVHSVEAADWRQGWTGYGWNTELFPDYKKFLREIKKKNLKITLNVHPSDGVRWFDDCYEEMAAALGRDASTCERIQFDLSDDEFINKYFSIVHKGLERDGVDFWWIDWQQGKNSQIKGLDPLWALNHYHYLDNGKDKKTPLILSRYAEIGSHRYPLGFSGDTSITWKTLKYLPYFTANSSNVGYTWWSHDIGGHHMGETSGELFARHIQFGVFSPILRMHCTNNSTISKEPWVYKNGGGEIVADLLRFRHRMIPWVYSLSEKVTSEGVPLIRPLYYLNKQEKAYDYANEYYFGDCIVAPVTTKMKGGYGYVEAWLPEGVWTDIFTGDEYSVPKDGKVVKFARRLENIPVLAPQGAIIPLSLDGGNGVENPQKLEVLCFEGNGGFTLFEDEETEGKVGRTHFESERSALAQTVKITFEGEKSVVPQGRTLRICFRNVAKGEVSVFENGKEIALEPTYGKCAEAEFVFDPSKTYTVTVKYTKRTEIEYLKARAKDILLSAECKNEEKIHLARKIATVKTVEEYVDAVNADTSLKSGDKHRLTETL